MVVYRPPMGFNTWNTFGHDINEELIRQLADAMVESGLRDAGYEYLVIDDVWQEKERNEKGELAPDLKRFPNGMKAVADYVHSKGLKFGIYSCVGTMTCAGYPGSYRHEYTDAKTFAEWGIDFLKYDYCYRSKNAEGPDLYRRMALALKNCGRDILFSACSWGHDETAKWIDTTGANMWRLTGDIKDSWEHIKDLARQAIEVEGKNFINCFTDLDMLIVGMKGKGYCALTGCTHEEYKTHFSFWSLFGSPLMVGCDIREMDEETRGILLNKELIAINQDKEFRRPFIMNGTDLPERDAEKLTVAKILGNGDVALGFFNFGDRKSHLQFFTLDMIGLDADQPLKITVQDLWTGEEYPLRNETIEVRNLQPHCCKMYRVRVSRK